MHCTWCCCQTPCTVHGAAVRHLALYVVLLSDTLHCTWCCCQTPCTVHGAAVRHLALYMVLLSDTLHCTWCCCQTPCTVHGAAVRHLALYMVLLSDTLHCMWCCYQTPCTVHGAAVRGKCTSARASKHHLTTSLAEWLRRHLEAGRSGFDSTFAVDFFSGWSHSRDLQIGTPVAAL